MSSNPLPLHASPEQPPPGSVPDLPGPTPAAGLPALGLGAAAAVIFAHFTADLFAGYAAPLQRIFCERWALPLWATSLLVLPGSLMVVFQPLLGLLSDRMRTRAFVVLGLLLAAGGYGATLPLASLFGRGTGYPLALAGIWAGAMGIALYHPQGAALTGLSGGRWGGRRAVSFFVFSGTVGYATGLFVPPLFFPERIPWASCLAALGLVALAGQRLVPRLRPAGERLARPSIGEALGRLVRESRPVFGELSLYCLITALRAAVLLTFTQLTSIYYGRTAGFSQLGGAALLAAFFLAQAALGLWAGAAADRFGDRPVLGLSLLAGGAALAGSVLWAGAGQPWPACVLLVAGGGLLGGSVPVNVAAAQRLLGRSEALASGLTIGLSWGLGGLLVPLLALAGDRLGATTTSRPAAALLTATALVVPAFVLVLSLPRASGTAGRAANEPRPPR